MAKEEFLVRVVDWAEVHQLPGSWPADRLRQILQRLEFDDPVTDGELPDMVLMALQDLEPRGAAETVLDVVFGDQMRSGVRQNLADDLEDDRPWEQFARVDKQAGIFEAMVLLQRAFPTHYGTPDAVRLRLEIQAADRNARALRGDPSAALVVRLLAAGMPGDAMLNRLYAEELASGSFPDAAAILWLLEPGPRTRSSERVCDICSSWQWLAPLEHASAWEAAVPIDSG